MLDPQLFRTDLNAIAAALTGRGYTLDVDAFQRQENERKALQVRTQELQARRNAASKQIGIAKGKGEDASALLAEVAGAGE
jgi:seryl-tRNA synthetase